MYKMLSDMAKRTQVFSPTNIKDNICIHCVLKREQQWGGAGRRHESLVYQGMKSQKRCDDPSGVASLILKPDKTSSPQVILLFNS